MTDINQSDETKNTVAGNLFEEIGMGDLSDIEKGAVLADLLESIQTRALQRTVEGLTDAQIESLAEVIKTDDPTKLEDFLLENAPNFPTIYEEEAKKLREELIIKFSGDQKQKE
ncbi:MAG: DUF5663 domain-containing protein [Candidatus Berkelbacteria bacterium]